MARRRDRERIYLARRSGLVARLVSTAVAPDRAEALVAAWEVEATAAGLARDGEAYWDEAWPWLEGRRWTRPRVVGQGIVTWKDEPAAGDRG